MEATLVKREQEILDQTEKIKLKLYLDIVANIFKDFTSKEAPLCWPVRQFSKKQSHFLLKKLKNIRIKGFDSLSLYEEKNQPIFRKFLKTYFIDNINSLYVTPVEEDLHKNNNYLSLVIRYIPNVSQLLYLRNFKISKNNFRKIIQIGRHMNAIKFNECNMNLKGLKFTNFLKYQIKLISFSIPYQPSSKFLEEFEENCIIFITAASSTTLKQSLRSFCTEIIKFHPSIEAKAKEISTRLGFTNLKIGV
ncbi:unnamed protein product [Moneuplotes crassus]|uniref:Uncharacterized protein n=1 Tax=Euplotes crassus TaxID=5936 RepID=A0AAD1UD62_EUPCR|nr:unnamed protein product [Moneuplotes crassus]